MYVLVVPYELFLLLIQCYLIRKNGGGNGANQDFTYPELLDLTWPPEGLLAPEIDVFKF